MLFLSAHLSRQVTGSDRYGLRGHRVGSGMPDDSLRSHARWSLRAVLLDIMPRQLAKLPGHFRVVPMRLLLEPGQKEQKPARFLCLPEPKKAGQRNLRGALGGAWPYCGHAAPGRAPTCAEWRRERKPPAAGTNPMTSCPSVIDPLVAPLLSSSVRGLKRLGSLLATPFRPPQGRPPFILPAR